MTNKNEVAVEVKIPAINLTLADLSFLRSLLPGKAENVTCYPTRKVKDKCMFLGLVEMADIKPCPKKIASFDKIQSERILKFDLITQHLKRDWEAISNLASAIRYGESRERPKATRDLVLTAAGRQLLAKGAAQSKTAAAGMKGCL